MCEHDGCVKTDAEHDAEELRRLREFHRAVSSGIVARERNMWMERCEELSRVLAEVAEEIDEGRAPLSDVWWFDDMETMLDYINRQIAAHGVDDTPSRDGGE